MHNIGLVMTFLGLVILLTKLKKVYKCLVLAMACMFLFSCTKSVTSPQNNPASPMKAFRLKQVDLDNRVNYSEIKMLN